MPNDELIMTSFGKGNEAIIEKKINGSTVENIPATAAFEAVAQEEEAKHFLINGRVKNAVSDNPLYRRDVQDSFVRDDIIHAREALEKRFFGNNFEDNIHIQTIYNIMDVEKILAIHINNIIYTINNLCRWRNEYLDVVGNLQTYKPLKEQKPDIQDAITKLCRSGYLRYYNIDVISEGKDKGKTDPNAIKLTEDELYSVLKALGSMRQMLAHGYRGDNSIYRYDYAAGKKRLGDEDIKKILDRLYTERVEELNRSFLTKAGKNLTLLFMAYGIEKKEEKQQLVEEYYDYVVRKTYKNLGVSIKTIREYMTATCEDAFIIRSVEFDSVRSKLYPFIDFAIYHYYRTKRDHTPFVNRLRSTLPTEGGEDAKDLAYREEALEVWKGIKDLVLNHMLPNMKGDVIKDIKPDPDVNAEMIENVKISTEASYFTKLMYLVTLFINGKEINDLLTTMISKVENIASFNCVMEKLQLEHVYQREFSLFEHSQEIAQELRVVNSFARMSKPSLAAKKLMYIEALELLGLPNDQCAEEMANDILDPEKKKTNPQKHGLRNFIANNVIESDRFHYLVRFGNPQKLKKLTTEKKVIELAMRDIPDAQIARYSNSINGTDERYNASMRNRLAEVLCSFSFKDISDVKQNDRIANREEQEKKRQKQALVRLYLTVLYLIVKNLVYVNNRYSQTVMYGRLPYIATRLNILMPFETSICIWTNCQKIGN